MPGFDYDVLIIGSGFGGSVPACPQSQPADGPAAPGCRAGPSPDSRQRRSMQISITVLVAGARAEVLPFASGLLSASARPAATSTPRGSAGRTAPPPASAP